MNRIFIFVTVLLFSCSSAFGRTYVVSSPDNRLTIEATLEDGRLNYSVSWRGSLIIYRGQVGFNVKGWEKAREWYLDNDLDPKTVTFNEPWTPVHGFKAEYPNAGSQVDIPIRAYTGEKMTLQLRASNEGVAFRCILSEGFGGAKEYVLDKELTTFPFSKDVNCFFTNTPQGAYDVRLMSSCPDMPPAVVVEIKKDALYAAIAEAGSLEDFVPMVLRPASFRRGTLEAAFRKGTVQVSGELTTPWRVIFVAENPGKFVENAYLLQNLCPPCEIKDTSWIQVGKVVRNSSCQRPDSDKWVDYNAANNYQFVHWDTGWNGAEYDGVPDHPTKIDGDRDLLGAIKYAHEKGQKFFLYCNHKELENYPLDETFKTYKQWGVDGVKFGFVNWETQEDMKWLHQAIKKAAEYKLLVNVHDNYRPTGWERTYPNLVSVEGIAGNECHDTFSAMPRSRILMAFVRPINGMGDFTPCFLSSRVKSRAFQLACGVIFFNPLQHLHWYDKPLEPDQTQYPELAFWSAMPATWDDTRVLSGVPGEYIVVARRKGQEWFISAITDKARDLEIPLKFLHTHIPQSALGDDYPMYTARIYRQNLKKPLECVVEKREVSSLDSITAYMTDEGGFNIRLTPME